MDAATLIERIEREIQEQEPLFAALQEALSGCDPDMRFGVPRAELPEAPAFGTPARQALASVVHGSVVGRRI